MSERCVAFTILCALSVAAGACAADASDSDEITPPPDAEVFVSEPYLLDQNQDGEINDQDDVNQDGAIDSEPRYYFNEAAFQAYCVVPDADSFDDYEDLDQDIPRGTRPYPGACEADGVVTGPLHAERFPSKWCKLPDCKRATPGGVGNEY